MALSGGVTKCNIGRLITFHALFHNGVIEAPKRYDVCVLSSCLSPTSAMCQWFHAPENSDFKK